METFFHHYLNSFHFRFILLIQLQFWSGTVSVDQTLLPSKRLANCSRQVPLQHLWWPTLALSCSMDNVSTVRTLLSSVLSMVPIHR